MVLLLAFLAGGCELPAVGAAGAGAPFIDDAAVRVPDRTALRVPDRTALRVLDRTALRVPDRTDDETGAADEAGRGRPRVPAAR
jgi:hypothetical protein